MRNTYLLVDFGDFVDGTSSTADPYVQLLSLTNDTAKAHQDFVNVRLGGKDTTGNQHINSTGSGSSGSGSGWNSLSSKTKKIIIISAAAGVGALLLLIALCVCCRNRGSRRATAGSGAAMGFGNQAYRPLQDPAPNAAVETYALPNLNYNQPPTYGGQPPYDPRFSQQQYQTAWDHHY